MNSRSLRILGFITLFVAVLVLIMAFVARPTVGSEISERWPGGAGVYSCADETGVAEEIVAMRPPNARASDPATGDTYLRYSRKLVIVSGEGTPDCRITVEGLDRINNGTFIWLGSGFRPASPNSSSGGSSGSGGGVK